MGPLHGWKKVQNFSTANFREKGQKLFFAVELSKWDSFWLAPRKPTVKVNFLVIENEDLRLLHGERKNSEIYNRQFRRKRSKTVFLTWCRKVKEHPEAKIDHLTLREIVSQTQRCLQNRNRIRNIENRNK